MIFGSGRSSWRSLFNLGIALAGALFLSTTALPQTNSGSLVGTVYDATGSIIPGARVLVIDHHTLNEKATISDKTGCFVMPLLDVGSYTVTISSQGFSTFKANNVVIEVGREYELRATLELGRIGTVVNVDVDATQINATTAELSLTVNSKQILDLPLDGRNPLNLILLQAGTSSNSYQNTSINGQRTAFTNITRDGINIQDAFIRTNATDFAPGRPSVDDTEEFTITTQNAGADQGYGGAQIRLVTPRGSTRYHGSLL